MTREQVIALIEETRIGFLATVDADGAPHARPVDIGVIYEGEVYFSTFSDSRKVRQLEANSKVQVVWLSPNMSQVRLSGEAALVKDETVRKSYLEDNTDASQMFTGEAYQKYQLYKIGPTDVEYLGPDDASYTLVHWE